jgi:hypothetical protein
MILLIESGLKRKRINSEEGKDVEEKIKRVAQTLLRTEQKKD